MPIVETNVQKVAKNDAKASDKKEIKPPFRSWVRTGIYRGFIY